MGVDIVCSKFPAIIIINDVEQPLRMKGSPTDEKGKDNGSYKQKEKLALFDCLLDCAGITALNCQVWAGLAVQFRRNFAKKILIISSHNHNK